MYKIVDFTDEEMRDYVRTVSRQRVHQMLTSMLVGCELHTKLLNARDFVKAEIKAGRFPENKAAKVRVQQASKKAQADVEMQTQSYKDSVPIKGYEDYRVSKDGRVWSEQTMCWLVGGMTTSGQGYRTVNISKGGGYKTYFVHRLVAQAFIPNPENKPTVNHIDGNAKNNNLENLEWATYKENTRHAIDTGLWNPCSVDRTTKLTEEVVLEVQSMLAKGCLYKDVASELGLGISSVGSIARGESHGASKPAVPRMKRLTDTQRADMLRLSETHGNTAIARELGIKYSTVTGFLRRKSLTNLGS